jgi:hypothetical protein
LHLELGRERIRFTHSKTMALNFLKGKPTKVHLGLLSQAQQAAVPFAPPTETSVTLTLDAAVLSTATSLALSAALTQQIPEGTSLLFSSGTAPNIVQALYTVTEDAAVGDEELTIKVAGKAIATGATATFRGITCVDGLTSASFQISTTDTTTDVFDCAEPGAEASSTSYGGFTDGLATAASWSSPLNGNMVGSSVGFDRLQYLGVNALRGAKGFAKITTDTPPGYVSGYVRSGVCQILDYSESYESTGLATVSATLQGRGDPYEVSSPVSA